MSGGPAFLRPLTELTARLCFVHFDGSDALVHARQNPNVALNDDFVKKHAKNVYDGISLLANWVAKL
jgi:aspartate aminotransferase